MNPRSQRIAGASFLAGFDPAIRRFESFRPQPTSIVKTIT